MEFDYYLSINVVFWDNLSNLFLCNCHKKYSFSIRIVISEFLPKRSYFLPKTQTILHYLLVLKDVETFFAKIIIQFILAHTANVHGRHAFRWIIHIFSAQFLNIWFHVIDLLEQYGTSIPIFESVIPVSVKAAEASAERISIYGYCIIAKYPTFQKRMTEIFRLIYSCSNQSVISWIWIPS